MPFFGAAERSCSNCGQSIPRMARGCRFCRRTLEDERSSIRESLAEMGWFSDPPRSYPEALTAYQDYDDREAERPHRHRGLSDLDLYRLYRDYMKHEDGLLASRLSSFLTMNTFLIGASVVILGGIIQLLAKSDLPAPRAFILVTGGTLIHCMIAFIGHRSAKLTQSSLMAATHSLAYLRDRGNYRLRAAISRGDLPYLTNGRGLSEKERRKLDKGSGIMRDIPRTMKWMWMIVGALPLAIPAALWIGLDRCPEWDIAPPPALSVRATFWRPALCAVSTDPRGDGAARSR